MSGRIVNAEEAQRLLSEAEKAPLGASDERVLRLMGRSEALAHTVVVQAEQIAAVLALCDQQDRMHATVSTDRVRRALGVTA